MQKVFSSLARILVVLLLSTVAAACSGAVEESVVSDSPAATLADTAVPPTPLSATHTPQTDTPEPETAPTEAVVEPVEVTYFTPSQSEGPYYTVDKPEDHDNDLTVVSGTAGTPTGQILEFSGSLYDAAGMPVHGAVIEIWQTDANGIYRHPGDPNTDQRDMNFQFYGEAVTAVDGSYNFRTILPGEYAPRPRHIHVKIKREGQALLTTQFYFEGDPALASEPMFNQTDGDGVHLVMSLVDGQDAAGNPILIGERDIVLSTTLAND